MTVPCTAAPVLLQKVLYWLQVCSGQRVGLMFWKHSSCHKPLRMQHLDEVIARLQQTVCFSKECSQVLLLVQQLYCVLLFRQLFFLSFSASILRALITQEPIDFITAIFVTCSKGYDTVISYSNGIDTTIFWAYVQNKTVVLYYYSCGKTDQFLVANTVNLRIRYFVMITI